MPVAQRVSLGGLLNRLEALEAKVSQLAEAATNTAEALDLIAEQIEQPASGPKSLDD